MTAEPDSESAADRAGSTPALRRVLGPADFTLLVVGAVVGADIYVVAGMGAKLLGPAQLVAWVVAGVLSALIAVAFIQCAAIYPDVGGSYAYAHQAFGPFLGFVSGWALYLGEWIALPVFPITFINYLGYFAPSLTHPERIGIACGLVLVTTLITIRGMRGSGWVNDALTIAKLLPLAVLIIFGVLVFFIHTTITLRQTHPFAPLGWSQFGPAVVLIFWAYAGFELAVLPAGEVRDPRRTLPRGLLVGMGIVTLFYLLTSWSVVTAIPSSVAATSTRPLSDALGALLSRVGLPGALGQICMSLGGLISIASVYEVFMLSLARLSYALASDGLFPSAFGRIHPRFETPYVGIVFQAAATLILAPFLGLSSLISIAVFFLGICYLFTALSALRLISRRPDRRLSLPGLRVFLGLAGLAGIVLATQSTPQHLLLGAGAMLAGLILYLLRKRSWGSWAAVTSNAAVIKAELETEADRGMKSSAYWILNEYRRLRQHNSQEP